MFFVPWLTEVKELVLATGADSRPRARTNSYTSVNQATNNVLTRCLQYLEANPEQESK